MGVHESTLITACHISPSGGMGIALNYPHHRRHHHCCRRCYHLFDSIRAIHSKGLKEMVTEGGGDLLVVPGFAAIQIV